MRHVLRFLGNRYGAALALIVVIAVVVAFGKLLGHGSTTPRVANPDVVNPIVTATVSQEPDDGLDQPSEAPPAPSTSPGAATPQKVATDFAKAWLNHTNISAADWFKAVSRYTTKALADKLNTTDPEAVPANKMTGDATVTNRAPSYVDVNVPLDAGTLSLRLVATGGRWLVDGVDWLRP